LKKKTGIVIDEYGQKIDESGSSNASSEPKNVNELMFKTKDPNASSKPKKPENTNYKPINTYKPSGNFIYNDDLINKLEDKFT
jgi:hypothetical protein